MMMMMMMMMVMILLSLSLGKFAEGTDRARRKLSTPTFMNFRQGLARRMVDRMLPGW